jgi:hypothetical protein
MSIYLEDDVYGSFVVDASMSDYVGSKLELTGRNAGSYAGHKLNITYFVEGRPLRVNSSAAHIGQETEHHFDLSQLDISTATYNVTAVASLKESNSTFYASTSLLRLPLRTDNGSATRLDHIYGGLAVRRGEETAWKPIFTYTYYVQWSLYWYTNLSTLDEFASMGYNVIHIVPTGDLGDTPFPWDEFEPYLNKADELGLLLQYDVRWEYANLSIMVDQVTRLASHPSILLWYTGDEPDGKSNPINSTKIAYETIRAIDPYHPVSLALNCADFYYSDYASGADIILSDVYPISTNTSYSTVYDTPCNATYGCCGCDNCNGAFEDISDRLDSFAHFDDVLGWQKTHWGATQAFGNETFWTRYPTAAEEVVMNMLSVNHAAKGIVMWNFPTTSAILNVTNALAAVLTTESVTKFLVNSPMAGLLRVDGADRVDATIWYNGDSLLLSVVNLNYGNLNGSITVHLPVDMQAQSINESLWGQAHWTATGNTVSTSGMLGLEVSLMVLQQCQSVPLRDHS